MKEGTSGPQNDIKGLAAYLAAEQRLGRVASTVDPQITANCLWKIFVQTSMDDFLMGRKSDAVSARKEIRRFLQILMLGLKPRPLTEKTVFKKARDHEVRFPTNIHGPRPVISLAGCAVSPDLRMPEMVMPVQYTEIPLPAQTVTAASEGGAVQRFVSAKDLPAEWWRLFNSPGLDQMIRQGLNESPTLAAAQAALRKAEEDLRAVKGSVLYPAVNADLQATRQRSSGNANTGASDTYNLYNASVAVSYTLDIFGEGRHQIESYRAEVDYQRYRYEATYWPLPRI
jgi:hypothetical protein